MAFEKLLANEKTDYFVVGVHLDGRRLTAALEVFAHADKDAATAVVSVDVDTLATEVLYATGGVTIDYAAQAGWHGLVQPTRVIELVDGKPRITKTGFKGEEQCSALARFGGKTFVSGTKKSPDGRYTTDGFIAEVSGGKLSMLVESSQFPSLHEGDLDVLCAGKDTLHASGTIVTRKPEDAMTPVVIGLRGGMPTLRPVDLPHIYALHEAASGHLWIGSAGCAAVISGKTMQKLTLDNDVRGIAEFGGTAYWGTHGQQGSLTLWRGTDNPKPTFKAKFHWVGYRSSGRRDLRMCANAELLVVANKDRVHVYDGKKWSQLAFQRDLGKLVKRVAAGMKPA
jgi:hypothetical protein